MTGPAVAARRWRARCTWTGCAWARTGSEQWVRAAWDRHRAEHIAAADAAEQRRRERYRWRGHPNPTQQRLLHQVSTGTVGAYECRVHILATGTSSHVWYPTNLTGQQKLWWPALVQAGLVHPRPLWSGGPVREGIWQLTAEGRRLLDRHPCRHR